jgi:hypothetical protein
MKREMPVKILFVARESLRCFAIISFLWTTDQGSAAVDFGLCMEKLQMGPRPLLTVRGAITGKGPVQYAENLAGQRNDRVCSTNVLVISGINTNSTDPGRFDVFRLSPTTNVLVLFKDNRFTARNSDEHIILFGGEASSSSDHKLDGITIIGNKIVWAGTDLTDDNEGILIGYGINAVIKYNFIQDCPYGTPTKSSGFNYTDGGVAYNVYTSSFKVGTGAKGLSGVRFYNNSFYNTRNSSQGVVGSIYINSNNDQGTPGPVSTNCQIYNNVFYTKHQVSNIYCDRASLVGLKCDYNLYWCEDGEPVFRIAGNTITLTQWKAMGYDQHSLRINPNFTSFATLIPSAPLNFGTNLGCAWQYGLDPQTQWNGSDPIVKAQPAAWQLGAYVR